jgi:hypothetical protein
VDAIPERHERQVEVVHAEVVFLVQEVMCCDDVQCHKETSHDPYRIAAGGSGQHGEGYRAQSQQVCYKSGEEVGASGNPSQSNPGSSLQGAEKPILMNSKYMCTVNEFRLKYATVKQKAQLYYLGWHSKGGFLLSMAPILSGV